MPKQVKVQEYVYEIPDPYSVSYFEKLFEGILFKGNFMAPINNAIKFVAYLGDDDLLKSLEVQKKYFYALGGMDKEFRYGKHPDYQKSLQRLRNLTKSLYFPCTIDLCMYSLTSDIIVLEESETSKQLV